MANLVLVGQGYPGCGPTGADEGARFYAMLGRFVNLLDGM